MPQSSRGALKTPSGAASSSRALIALNSLGLRIPEDVAVVSHANKGHGPVWEKPLTRLEMDPVAHGKALAREIAAYLRGGTFPSRFVLGSKWIEGKTF